MHPLPLLLIHLAVFGGGLLVVLFGLLFATGPGVAAGERAVLAFLVVSVFGSLANCYSLHRRLPEHLGLGSRLGLDLLCLLASAAVVAALGLVALVLFNR